MPDGTFSGVIAPVLTPFKEDLSVDTERFVAFCRQLLDEGCDALAVFGTTSEANSLSLEERLSLLDALIDGGVPAARLLVGTGCCALPETVRLTRAAVDKGAGGVLLLPPFYYKTVADAGLYAFAAETIRAVDGERLHIYLYHIPPVAQVGWSPELVERLMADFPGTVVGVKDSSGQFDYTRNLLSRYPGFAVFVGNELYLWDALELGGPGTITALANVNAPALRRLYSEWGKSHGPALNEAVCAVRRTVQAYPTIPALKAILAERTGDPGWTRVRPPLTALPDAQARQLSKDLQALEALAPAPPQQH